MRNTILISLLLMLLPVSVSAQFYTITRDSEILPTERRKESYNRAAKDVTEGKKNKMMVRITITLILIGMIIFLERQDLKMSTTFLSQEVMTKLIIS